MCSFFKNKITVILPFCCLFLFIHHRHLKQNLRSSSSTGLSIQITVYTLTSDNLHDVIIKTGFTKRKRCCRPCENFFSCIFLHLPRFTTRQHSTSSNTQPLPLFPSVKMLIAMMIFPPRSFCFPFPFTHLSLAWLYSNLLLILFMIFLEEKKLFFSPSFWMKAIINTNHDKDKIPPAHYKTQKKVCLKRREKIFWKVQRTKLSYEKRWDDATPILFEPNSNYMQCGGEIQYLRGMVVYWYAMNNG